MLKAGQQLAGGAVKIDETESCAREIIVLRSVLLGIGNEKAATYILNVKGSEALGDAFVIKCVVAIASERVT